MQKIRAQKGITLIALIITIIVMLILVGVSVTVALNGGLFTTAKEAAEGTASKRDEELNLSDGKVEINGEWYNSIDEYVNGTGNGAGGQTITITPKKENYEIGDEVTIGEESFYVIADDTEKVTLLAKYGIDTTNLVQSSNASGVAFSSTNYWSSETNIDDLNLNEYPIPEGITTPALTAAKTYGTKVGGTGRLMTKAEADELNTEEYSAILYGSSSYYPDGENFYYWLGSARVDKCNYLVYADDLTMDIIHWEDCTDPWYKVRPVVEISKSNLS